MRKLILSASFFIFTPIFILIGSFYILFLFNSNHDTLVTRESKGVAFAALPSVENVFEDTINFSDARIDKIKQFFQQYKSPLIPFAENVVKDADKYGLDYRLLPAIAMQESNLCKKIILDSFNCWGFGIYGKKVTRFESYSEAIDTVSKTLANNYIAGGLDTPEKIMKKYTPSNDGSWAYSVNHFMNLLK